MNYWPRDGKLPELGDFIILLHVYFGKDGVKGVVTGIEVHDDRIKLWLDDGNRYDLYSVSWTYA